MLVTESTPEELIFDDRPPVYCRWVAAWNPVLFTFVRKDSNVASIADSSGNARINLVSPPSPAMAVGDKVYVFVEGKFDGVFTILSLPSTSSMVIDTDSMGTETITGYANNLTKRPNYYATIKIRDRNDLPVTTIKYTPKTNGVIFCDVQGIVQSKLSNESDDPNIIDPVSINFTSSNASFQFRFTKQEFWTGSSESEFVDERDYFAVNGAFQIGHFYNGNYVEYLPCNPSELGVVKVAKFLSPFEVPTVYPNYPYSLSFLWDLTFLTGTINVTSFINYTSNINELPPNNKTSDLAALTAPDDSGLTIFGFSLGSVIGVDNRRKAWVWLQRSASNLRITEQRMVKIKPIELQACNSIFLRWLAPDGSFGFYLFEGNYRETTQVDLEGTYRKSFNRIDNLKGINRVKKKNQFKKFQVGMTGLDKNDSDGISTLLGSPMVYMITQNALTGTFNEVEVIVEPGTFAVKAAKSNLFDIEFSFVFPEAFNQGA